MRIKALLLFVLLLLLTACGQKEFTVADGSQQSFDRYRGQWLLINYWAEWCRPCLEEIPELNRINRKPDFQVFGYDYDKGVGSSLAEKADRLGIEFPLILEEPSQLFSLDAPNGLPATIVIGKDGQFVKWLMGPQTEHSINQSLL